ncbi:sulfotransferase domain-containing protein [Methylorubrum aminovorans]
MHINKYNVIVSLGLYRSASTWMFNVIKSLVSIDYSIVSVFADNILELNELLQNNDEVLLIKTHIPDPSLQSFIKYSNAKVLITIRDPLDCVASFMRQFHLSFEDALNRVNRSCLSILELKSIVDHAIFIYESPESRNASMVLEIADFLKVTASDTQCEKIAQELKSENVRNFIDKLTDEKYFSDSSPADQYHAETHWHPRHVGEGASGLYCEVLSERQAQLVRYTCKKFRNHFGYNIHDKISLVRSKSTILFSDIDLAYCCHGFFFPEDWGIWTVEDSALLILPLQKISSTIRLKMQCVLSPAMRSSSGTSLSIMLNECRIFDLDDSESNAEPLYISAFANLEPTDRILMKIDFRNLRANNEIDNSPDTRKLGIGLVKLQIEYQ